jgi:hypothetical protein
LIRFQSWHDLHKEKDMKRILAALFLALVVALVGPIGVAGADPPHDFTTGGGKVVVTLIPDSQTMVEKFAFSAHAIGSTTGARNGHYVYEQTQTFTEVRGRGIVRTTSPVMTSAQLAPYGVALRDT